MNVLAKIIDIIANGEGGVGARMLTIRDLAKSALNEYHQTPVREFHEVFEHPVRIGPCTPSMEERLLRVKLIAEELAEYVDACGVRLFVDTYKPPEQVVVVHSSMDIYDAVEAADALGDLRVVVDGGNLIHGFNGEAVLQEIHRSNMSKAGADGKPIKREDGKILKGPDYFKPNIAAVMYEGAALAQMAGQ